MLNLVLVANSQYKSFMRRTGQTLQDVFTVDVNAAESLSGLFRIWTLPRLTLVEWGHKISRNHLLQKQSEMRVLDMMTGDQQIWGAA